jgi:hypothetical protein
VPETAKDRFEKNSKIEYWILKQANEFTATFPKPGKPLDYSEMSLRHLDELKQDLMKSIPSGPKRLQAVYGAGAYFGEVFHRNLGGRWVLSSHPGMQFTSTFEVEGGQLVKPFQQSETEFNGEGEGFDIVYRQIKGLPTLSPTPMKPVSYTIVVEDFGPRKKEMVDLVIGMFHLPPESEPQILDGSAFTKLSFPTRSHVEAFAERVAAIGVKVKVNSVREEAQKPKHPLSPGQAERIAAQAVERHAKGNPRILLVVWSVVQQGDKWYIDEKNFGVHPELYFASKADATEFLTDISLALLKNR